MPQSLNHTANCDSPINKIKVKYGSVSSSTNSEYRSQSAPDCITCNASSKSKLLDYNQCAACLNRLSAHQTLQDEESDTVRKALKGKKAA